MLRSTLPPGKPMRLDRHQTGDERGGVTRARRPSPQHLHDLQRRKSCPSALPRSAGTAAGLDAWPPVVATGAAGACAFPSATSHTLTPLSEGGAKTAAPSAA